MSCRVIEDNDLISKYLNGQLNPEAQDQLELHILECPTCQEAVELYQTVRDEVAVRAHEIRTYRSPRGRLRWSWVAVAALIVIVSGIGFREFALFHRAASPGTLADKGIADKHGAQGSPIASAAPVSSTGTPSNLVPLDESSKRQSAGSGTGRSPSKPPRTVVTTEKTTVAGVPQGLGKNSVDAIPANGRNYIDRTNPTTAQDSAPAIGPDSTALKPGKLPSTASNDAEKAASSRGQASDAITQLAAVRPLPYTFSGVAGSRAFTAGSTRGSHVPASAVSDSAGTNARSGTSGFRTPQGLFQDAMTSYVERHYGEAADLLAEAVRLDPQFAEANLYLGISRLLEGKTGDALPALQSAFAGKKPAVAQAAHFYMGKAYLQLGKLEEAETEFHSAASIDGRLAGEASSLILRLQAIRHAADAPSNVKQ